jgi:tRNA(Ile)-lysidine synthase
LKDSLQHRFESFIQTNKLFNKNNYLLLACSGGIDSVVLCQLLGQAGYPFEIAHCNFQLRGEDSVQDEAFVEGLGIQFGLKVHIRRFETEAFAKDHGLSIQMAARQLRYEWFRQLLDAASLQPAFLLTAHHADDSIETVLMNMFKETGITGMHGILPKQDRVVRPLLFARKTEIQAYAESLELYWREDSSNSSDKYTRNFFRLSVLPLIDEAIPKASDNFLATIGHLKEVEQVYLEAIAQRKRKLLKRVGAEMHIPVAKLKLEQPLQTMAYEIIRDFGFTNQQLPDFINLLDAATGKHIASNQYRIIKNRNWLIVAPLHNAEASVIVIEEDDPIIEFDHGRIHIKTSNDIIPSNKKEEACLDAKEIKFPLLLRKWKQGDYFYPLGMPKKKKVARFLIDQKLSATEKENVWVIESDRKIIWIVGHRIDDRVKITGCTKQVLKIVWAK